MKETADILAAWNECRAAGRDAALATVVRVEGSAYRRPGARMLILDNADTVGSVSGGCIERDVLLRAGAVRAGGSPVVVRYESVSEEEAGPAASLGCGGTVDVLIESLKANDENNPLRPLEWLWSRRKRGVIATVIRGEKLGWQIAMDDAGQFLSSLPSSQSSVLSSSLSLRAEGSPRLLTDAIANRISQYEALETYEVFVEYVDPPQELIIFGAGADAVPHSFLAKSLGWRVTIVDLRSGPVVVERKFDADVILRRHPNQLDDLAFPFDAAVLVMTHNWMHDLAVIERLRGVPLRYLGILGPRKRTERMFARIGKPIAENLRYPVGLDIGARNPEEISLAIIAEITSVRRDASGTPLLLRTGPIHARPDDSDEPFTENSSCSRAG
jgi:xanthine/CO dehydrogenase XdhC/CoxF family maturation factor